jgi:hypothetical protein
LKLDSSEDIDLVIKHYHDEAGGKVNFKIEGHDHDPGLYIDMNYTMDDNTGEL